MLIEFSVGNYRSFKDTVTFSMRAAKLYSKDKQLDKDAVFPVRNKLGLLKSAAIYGANASGKSNLIAALRFMLFTVLSFRQISIRPKLTPFILNTETENGPSYFQIIFSLDNKIYRYGFEIDKNKIHAEWLYHRGERETALFLREEQEFELSGVFKEGKDLTDKTRPDVLFLSVVDQFNGTISGSILRWFNHRLRVISGLSDNDYIHFTARLMDENAQAREEIIAFVKALDVGIVNIQKSQRSIESQFPDNALDNMHEKMRELLLDPEIRQNSEKLLFDTQHKKYNGAKEEGTALLRLEQESEGTRKLFFLAGLLLNTLQTGSILIIDEFDARLHPLLSAEIIRLFRSHESNPLNAQLIFSTHDTNLLDKDCFRRDQIWFTEKNRYGATDLYSLSEYKVRNDASYAKDYISGKYGAIPYLGNIEQLFEDMGNA